MIVTYGSHSHEDNEATLRVEPIRVHSEFGHLLETNIRFLIDGKIIRDTKAETLAAFIALERAYLKDKQDITLKHADGTVVLRYRSQESTTGIMVRRIPSSTEFMGVEWARTVNYSIILEANYRNLDLASTFVVAFNAGVSTQGTGGAAFKHVPAKTGPWRKQITTATTPVRKTQFGSVTGLRQYPVDSIPFPFWPDDEIAEARKIEYVRSAPNFQTQFTINYSYEYERNGPFPG